jgi:hypothetical protein
MIKLADSRGLFSPLRPRSIKQRVSLYADDVVVFLSPVVLDLVMIRAILDFFPRTSGLATNINKSKAFPIRCDEEQLSVITHTLGCQCADFPCTYLGVPLSPKRLPKSAMQSVIDKVARSTLCAIPVHISMATKIAPWAIRAIEKLVRGFLWCGSEVAVGGKCAVAWVNAACPVQHGGLGIPNLQLMGFALRLRWLWLDRVDSDKTWSGYFFRADRSAQAFFEASVTMQVDDGSRALFWSDRWLNGCSILQLAPIDGIYSY